MSSLIVQSASAIGVDCDNPAAPVEAHYCAEQRAAEATAELERTYRHLLLLLASNPDRADALREAQAAWARYRDLHCTFDNFWVQGSSLGMLINQCREGLSSQRAAQLGGFVDDLAQPSRQASAQAGQWQEAPPPAVGQAAWYVILGSFPQTEVGIANANQRADDLLQGLGVANLVVSETVFYQGLTPGLYVVMAGPYTSADRAKQALSNSRFRTLVKDAYVKRVFERPFD